MVNAVEDMELKENTGAEFSGNMQIVDDFDKSRFSVHQNGLKTNMI